MGEERKTPMRDNAKLLKDYCYLTNKTILFVQKYFEGVIPAGKLDEDIYWKTKAVYEQIAQAMEQHPAQAQELLEEYLGYANAYFENGKPWETRISDRRACRNTILNSIQLVANLTVLLAKVAGCPTAKVSSWLELNGQWKVQKVCSGYELPNTESINQEEIFQKYAFQKRQDKVS